MGKVARFAAFSLNTPNLSHQAEFYTDRWGLEAVEDHDGSIYLRAEGPRHHVLSLHEGEDKGLRSLVFEATPGYGLNRIHEELLAAEVDIVSGPADSTHAGIGQALQFRDPDGNLVEIVDGIETNSAAYGNRDIKPQDVNHAVIESLDPERLHKFYTDIVGFQLTESIKGIISFYRCSTQHHSFAITSAFSGVNKLNHVAFDLTDWEAWARAIYYAGERGIARVEGPGRHGPGNNLFSYYADEDDSVVEYTTEIEYVDIDSPPVYWDLDARPPADRWKQKKLW